MDFLRHFVLEESIDQALAFQPALTLKGGGDNLDAEVRLAAGPGARMAGVTMGFVHDLKALRVECRGKLFSNSVLYAHA